MSVTIILENNTRKHTESEISSSPTLKYSRYEVESLSRRERLQFWQSIYPAIQTENSIDYNTCLRTCREAEVVIYCFLEFRAQRVKT